MAEYQAAQLALQRSQNQDVRSFAQKMITDHTYAQDTLAPIAQAHHIQSPGTLSEQHRVHARPVGPARWSRLSIEPMSTTWSARTQRW